MSGLIQKIIHLCGKHYFLRPVITQSGNSSIIKYKFGPPGEILRNNIYQEWFLSSVINTEESMLPYSELDATDNALKDFREAFVHAKEMLSGKLPLGFCCSKHESMSGKKEALSSDILTSSESTYFHPLEYTALRIYVFTSPADSSQLFNHWQRQRKLWWRKFSGSPGRYTLTDLKNSAQGETVMIKADFPWGTEMLESICLKGSKPFEEMDHITRSQFEVKDNRRNLIPHVIESTVNLDGAVLAFLSDAFEEHPCSVNRKSSTNVNNDDISNNVTLHLHRRLAPYKTSFSTSSSNSSSTEDLVDLATYLTRVLRRAGISVLLLPDVAKKSLEAQHTRNDEMGIPYTIVLNETTLRNGIVGVRSRDTTLKEQLHITDLKSHMRLLLKNY